MSDPLSEVLKQGKRQLKKSRPTQAKADPAYEKKKRAAAAASAAASREGRDVGPLPAVADPDRKARCRSDLLEFARTYFPARFPIAFGAPHVAAAARLQRVTESGGLFALAMPRGTGKTTLAEVEVIRALAYGFRRFALLLQATEDLASESLRKIQREFEANDLLAADFPEICHPVRRLERIHNRAKGQLLNGKPTLIEWTADGLRLPRVDGAPSSGAVLRVAGITGSIRGMSAAGPAGEILRPDLVLIDDAQTRGSAESPVQTASRRATITDDVLGLAGPDRPIAAVLLCTVIAPGDLSDQFLDSERFPQWQGQRTRLIEEWPADLDAWDQYAEVRREEQRSDGDGSQALAHYLEHRDRLDRGCVVSWPGRIKKGDASAIQTAMNLWIDNPRGFKAEYQNEPEGDGASAGVKELLPATVAARTAGTPRGAVPVESTRLTAFVDVGAHLHWYAVTAWDPTFGGVVIDYGAWPRQTRTMFAAADPRPGLAYVYPGASEEQRVYAGLEALTADVLGRVYRRESGDELRVDRCLIDTGWSSQTVHQFCRNSPHAASIYPSKGVGRSATAVGVARWKRRAGETSGMHWRGTVSETGRGRMIQYDPDHWKTFLYQRLTTAPGGRGCLQFYAGASHALIGEHCAAEYAEPVTMRGETFDKWQLRPNKPDNHLWDCLVGSAVAASVAGLEYSSTAAAPPPPPARLKLSEIQAAKRTAARGR